MTLPEPTYDAETRTLLVPPERLFWSIVPAAEVERLGDGLFYRVESELPRSVEGLQLVQHRLESGAVLVVAVEGERLRAWQEAHAGHAQVLPTALPPFITAAGVAESVRVQLNLAVGRHLPRDRHQYQQRVRWTVAALIVLGVVAVLIGVERRAGQLNQQAAAVQRDADAALAASVPPGGGQRSDVRLLQLQRRLEQAAAGGMGPAAPDLVAAWLRLLPSQLPLTVTAVRADANQLQVTGRVPDADARRRVQQAIPRIDVADSHFLYRQSPDLPPTRGELTVVLVWHREGTP